MHYFDKKQCIIYNMESLINQMMSLSAKSDEKYHKKRQECKKLQATVALLETIIQDYHEFLKVRTCKRKKLRQNKRKAEEVEEEEEENGPWCKQLQIEETVIEIEVEGDEMVLEENAVEKEEEGNKEMLETVSKVDEEVETEETVSKVDEEVETVSEEQEALKEEAVSEEQEAEETVSEEQEEEEAKEEQEEEQAEEEEEEEQEEEEEAEEEEEEQEEEEEAEEEEEEVSMVHINGKHYYATNERNGTIYEMLEDEEIGEEVGKYVNGIPVFN